MNKIAIVVQRCHESIVGGAESLAWQYATLLKDKYQIEVLTTTAVDAGYWTNVLPEGVEIREGISIRRFYVDIGYTPYRTDLTGCLTRDFDSFGLGKNTGGESCSHLPWSISLQEELIRHIGPYSESLLTFLKKNWRQYRTIIFITYLYPTSYFGLWEVPPGFALFAPTLHDEQFAYLSAYMHAARRAGSVIWLSNGEQRLGRRLWGDLRGQVVGTYIEAGQSEPFVDERGPYLLYCGRIDPNKGCSQLFEYFIQFKQDHPSQLRLILTGKADVEVPEHPDIEFRGFVSEKEMLGLMAGATIYVMPSGRESFSIVTLEAMAQRTPVLASGVSEVLVDHITQSGAGKIYRDYVSFAARLGEMLADKNARKAMGIAGRAYVTSRFTRAQIKEALVAAIESCVSSFENKDVDNATPGAQSKLTKESEMPQVFVEPKSIDISYAQAMPLPAGWTEQDLRTLVTSIQVDDGPVEELRNYATDDFRRFIYTLGLVPETTGLKILELGANPYFTTTLLHKFRAAELHLANYFGGDAREGSQKVTIHETGEVLSFPYKQFNIETDSFPYPDESFDVVLFCEIIEHLLSDPVHPLLEIRRVLKATGILVVTTPNVARLENVNKIFSGQNIYDPYSGYGPYGRHNREYTQQDLFGLLSVNGFQVDSIFTADVRPNQESESPFLDQIRPFLKNRHPQLGQYIFCKCSLKREARDQSAVRPDWLYRSMPGNKEAKA
jgi:glycosyltransferase involved in cell wall biosynthesis/SAM-dependent methyltransferase